MIKVELKSHKDNLNIRFDDDGRFWFASDFVFIVVAAPRHFIKYEDTGVPINKGSRPRKRFVIPALSISRRRLHARRIRAGLVREHMLCEKEKTLFSYKEIDDAFAEVLRQDGVAPWKVRAQRAGLYVTGLLRRLYKYWRVPVTKKTTKKE